MNNAIKILGVLVVIIVIEIVVFNIFSNKNKKEDITVKLEQPEFFLSETPTKEYLIDALVYYEVDHPDIVLAQAILETGYFRSKVCKEYNNLFGLYNSRTKDYYKFKHWTESVKAYKKYIQYRYEPPNNYYGFLNRIGYAEDPMYIKKVKSIVDKIGQEDGNKE